MRALWFLVFGEHKMVRVTGLVVDTEVSATLSKRKRLLFSELCHLYLLYLANVISLNWLFQLNMISLPGTAVYSFKAGGFEALDKQADYSRTARRVVFIQAALREVQRGQLHPSNETCQAFQCELALHQSNHPHTPSPTENLQFM